MIYFDNSATSYPKPQNVIRGVNTALKRYSFNSGRGGYKASVDSAEMIYNVREKIARMFGFSSENIIFTKNCTEALNIAIKGSVKKGDHVIISDLEHNSVSRVVEALAQNGTIEYDKASYSPDDDEMIERIKALIKPSTSIIIMTYASNAFGVILPIQKIGALCKKHGIRFIVDGAQGAGIGDINAKRDNIDILCAPGHKCLFGAMGSGFIAIKDEIMLEPLMHGGTGSASIILEQPTFSPDRYEAGTLNNIGIISIGEGIDYINSIGREKIYKHEMEYAKYIYKQLSTIGGIKLYTPAPELYKSMPIVSFNLKDYTSERVANVLAQNDICVRGGYHCAPLAHEHFGTMDNGTVRISPGCFNTEKECINLVNIVKKM